MAVVVDYQKQLIADSPDYQNTRGTTFRLLCVIVNFSLSIVNKFTVYKFISLQSLFVINQVPRAVYLTVYLTEPVTGFH